MTPGARVAAAIEILDRIGGGMAAEQALTAWARANRFAGSGDRAAIRDHVFDVLRRKRSCAALGGGNDGRALMIGLFRGTGVDPSAYFTGDGYAPEPLTADEGTMPGRALTRAERLDVPGWLLPELDRSLVDRADQVLDMLRDRAPVFLRVNLARADRAAAKDALTGDGIGTAPVERADTALVVTKNPRRVRSSRAYREGLVELQDASCQAAVASLLPIRAGARVLDYCAGGGGKALALAALTGGPVAAHDADPGRMADLPVRAARAGAEVVCLATDRLRALGPWDLVLADVPCSGTGAWRRQPDAKWRLTARRLDELRAIQADILERAAARVAPGGRLAYATCSILKSENGDQIARFLTDRPDWRLAASRTFLPSGEGDGFYIAELTR